MSPQQSRARVEFDAAAITVPFERAKRRNLRRIVRLTAQFARDSMTSSSGSAAPGSPPHSHGGQLRNSIVEQVTEDAAIVGPAEFSSRVGYSVPEILEFGGFVTRTIRQQRGRRQIFRRLLQRYRPHPYMRPAFERAQRSWIQMWRDCLFG